MKIEILQMKDNPDGSVDCNVEMDADAISYLLRFAIVKVLDDAVALAKKEYTPDPVDDRQMELFDE